MEASENPGLRRGRRGRGDLHRIDPQHLAELLRSDPNAAGYMRLELMLGTVLPRLTADAENQP